MLIFQIRKEKSWMTKEGVNDQSKAYKLHNLINKRIVVDRDVIFNEENTWWSGSIFWAKNSGRFWWQKWRRKAVARLWTMRNNRLHKFFRIVQLICKSHLEPRHIVNKLIVAEKSLVDDILWGNRNWWIWGYTYPFCYILDFDSVALQDDVKESKVGKG